MDKSIQFSGLIKKELLLLKPFTREPWSNFTLSEIKGIAKKTSHHYVFEALKKFVQLDVLKEARIGNTNSYSLNLESDEGISFLALVERINKEDRKDIPYAVLAKIFDRISSPFYSLIITGSYAEKKQKPSSDLDVIMIIPDSDEKKKYSAALKEGELVVPEVHGHIFTQEEFCLMLTNKEFNLGKEAAKKHIIVYGAEAYYKILFEAMRNGFKGGYAAEKGKK